MFSPHLETDRLLLVNMGPEHLDFVFSHFSQPDVHQFLVDEEPVRTMADAEEIVEFYEEPERRRRNRWVLVDRATMQPIGTLGLHACDERNRSIEVSYDLGPGSWGKGLMSEALTAALRHAFSTLGVYRVEAHVQVENDVRPPSLRSARAGFRIARRLLRPAHCART